MQEKALINSTNAATTFSKKKKTIVKQDSRRQENMELDLLGLY